MDAFFASVEQLDNPELKGLPVIVGGSPEGRGVVAACSYEARAFGVHSAMASARAAKLCPHAIFLHPRIQRYREISRIIREIFHQYTNLVEPLSLDEAYLDLTENSVNQPSASILAEKIRQQICTETGLTATAGVAENKFLAKVASGMNKPNGLTVIHPDAAFDFIQQLPIGKFYGIGKVTEKRMLQLGIQFGKDLHACTKEFLFDNFGRQGEILYQLVRGVDNRPVEPSRERKSIGCEKTFAHDLTSMKEIDGVVIRLSDSLARACEKAHVGGRTIVLKVRYNDFSTITRSRTVSGYISAHTDIYQHAKLLLRATRATSRPVRLLGISLNNLAEIGSTPIQLTLPF